MIMDVIAWLSMNIGRRHLCHPLFVASRILLLLLVLSSAVLLAATHTEIGELTSADMKSSTPIIHSTNLSTIIRTVPADIRGQKDTTGYVQLDARMLNTTAHEGATIRIRCEITGYPLPRYQWLLGRALLNDQAERLTGVEGRGSGGAEVDSRVDIKTTPWGSRLRIKSVTAADAGLYSCEGFNAYGQQTTSGHVTILTGAVESGQIDEYDDEDEEDDDEYVDYSDEVVHEEHNDVRTLAVATAIDKTAHSRSQTNKAASKAEQASGKGGKGGGNYVVQRYNGILCSDYIGNGSLLLLDKSLRDQTAVERKITATLSLMAVTSGDLASTASCMTRARATLCLYAFPRLDDVMKKQTGVNHVTARRGTTATDRQTTGRPGRTRDKQGGKVHRSPAARRLCAEDCRAFEREPTCGGGSIREAAQRLKRENDELGLSPLLLVDCTALPEESSVKDNKVSESCLRVDTFRALTTPALSASVVTDGDAQLGHSVYIILPSVAVPSFLCVILIIVLRLRCRTSSSPASFKKSQYFAADFKLPLPVVTDVNATTAMLQHSGAARRMQQTMLNIRAQDIVVVRELGEGSYGKLCSGRLLNVSNYLGADSVAMVGGSAGSKTSTSVKLPTSLTTPSSSRRCKSSRDGRVGRGGGSNGLSDCSEDVSEYNVMVKILKNYYDCLTRELFRKEAERLIELDHENLVRLIGISVFGEHSAAVMTSQPMCLLYEELSEGSMDLRQFILINSAPRFHSSNPSSHVAPCQQPFMDHVTSMTHRTAATIAVQLAAALRYLASRGLVHRDVAARNVWISRWSPLTIKLSDFSLSVFPYASDYSGLHKLTSPNQRHNSAYPIIPSHSSLDLYRSGTIFNYQRSRHVLNDCGNGIATGVSTMSSDTTDDILLPIRWMSPESLFLNQYSEFSDVWSYAVVLWELYSSGAQPYDGCSDEDVVAMLREGRTLPIPIACPRAVGELMRGCWAEEPACRPNFGEVHSLINEWLAAIVNEEDEYNTPRNPSTQYYADANNLIHPHNYTQRCMSPNTTNRALYFERYLQNIHNGLQHASISETEGVDKFIVVGGTGEEEGGRDQRGEENDKKCCVGGEGVSGLDGGVGTPNSSSDRTTSTGLSPDESPDALPRETVIFSAPQTPLIGATRDPQIRNRHDDSHVTPVGNVSFSSSPLVNPTKIHWSTPNNSDRLINSHDKFPANASCQMTSPSHLSSLPLTAAPSQLSRPCLNVRGLASTQLLHQQPVQQLMQQRLPPRNWQSTSSEYYYSNIV